MSQLDHQKLYYEKKLTELAVKSFENRKNINSSYGISEEDDFNHFVDVSILEMKKREKNYFNLLLEVCEFEKNVLHERKEVDASTNLMNKILNYDVVEIDLKHQRKDICFYLLAQLKVHVSPLKDELIGADLVLKKKKGKRN